MAIKVIGSEPIGFAEDGKTREFLRIISVGSESELPTALGDYSPMSVAIINDGSSVKKKMLSNAKVWTDFE